MNKAKALKYLIVLFSVSFLIAFISCNKSATAVDSETQSVVDNSICEQEFMQIQPTANARAINTKGTGAVAKMAGITGTLTPCDTLHKLSGDTSWTMPGHINPTYEYDLSSCTNVNGDNIARTGKYNIRLTGPIKKAGSQMIILLQNYKVSTTTYACDSMRITTLGSVFTSTVVGTIPTSFSFKIEVFNAVCTGGTGWVIKYNSSKTVTINTQGTAAGNDDVMIVTGTSNGINRNNLAFTVNVNQITKGANCKFITSGTLDITPAGFSIRTVDYGNGTCDDDATFTVNGQTVAFKMK